MTYTPTKTPLPGVAWIPSNGTEAEQFMHDWCRHCARDKAMRDGADFDECDDNDLCEIIAAAYRGQAVEWRELSDGSTKCVAFIPADRPIPQPRCEHTPELF